MRIFWLLVLTISLGCVLAQDRNADGRWGLDDLSLALESDELVPDVSTITEAILSRGINFDAEQRLGDILASAAKAKRDPQKISTLISACLRVCQTCRARALAPMTEEDLRVLLTQWHFSPEAIIREVETRGVKGLPNDDAQVTQLRAWGASEDLIKLVLPDDKIPALSRGDDYKRLALKRAVDYDPSAQTGVLSFSADLPANSQSEFVFVHTGLFVKALKGEAPVKVDAYFDKPGPRNVPEELIDYGDFKLEGLESPVDEKSSGSIFKKGKPKIVPPKPLVLSYSSVPDADGRNPFTFTLANNGTAPQHFKFTLHWQVLTTPKAKPPAQPDPKKK
jgi:hypothetical protein